ncbi:TSUP family transporter [Mycobacterium sp. WMMD1722]|uniref:TSUP family transporter n=1 Tax=Mycobacterium sp. WMMD1722 TaxID=3404117 RepID=UPI003BF61301
MFAVLFIVALAAGVLGGLVYRLRRSFLLPLLVVVHGPREAVPIMAIAAVPANVGRVAAWWRQIDWTAVSADAVPGVPAAVLGARTLLSVSPRLIDLCLAAFFGTMIAVRRRFLRSERRTH